MSSKLLIHSMPNLSQEHVVIFPGNLDSPIDELCLSLASIFVASTSLYTMLFELSLACSKDFRLVFRSIPNVGRNFCSLSPIRASSFALAWFDLESSFFPSSIYPLMCFCCRRKHFLIQCFLSTTKLFSSCVFHRTPPRRERGLAWLGLVWFR